MNITVIKAPAWVVDKAVSVLKKYRHQRQLPKRILSTGNLSLKVNRRWRLLSKNQGKSWQLMSHERYNTQKDIK